MTFSRNIRIVFLVSLACTGPAAADDGPSAKEIQQAFANAAKDYKILREGSATPLALYENSVLRWANPERSEQQGSVFIWQEDGMPMAIGSFFTFEYRGLRAKHEFHSIADVPLTASFQGKTAWTPRETGVTWKELEEFGAPPRPKSLRLTRMKQIASGFEVQLINPDGDDRKLRLLRTPLLRFSSPSKNVADGAIFSYTVATDPEALLIIRIRKDRWEYAFARFHYWQLEARRKGNLVWQVSLDMAMEGNRLGDKPEISKVYNSFYPAADYLFHP